MPENFLIAQTISNIFLQLICLSSWSFVICRVLQDYSFVLKLFLIHKWRHIYWITKLPPSLFCPAKMFVLPRLVYLVSQKWVPKSSYFWWRHLLHLLFLCLQVKYSEIHWKEKHTKNALLPKKIEWKYFCYIHFPKPPVGWKNNWLYIINQLSIKKVENIRRLHLKQVCKETSKCLG